jgi:hypothetical protein
LCDSLLELGQLQLELGDDRRAAFGGLPVLLAPGLGEEQLQALDLQPGAGHRRFRRQPCGTLGEDHRVCRGKIGRQRSVFRHHVAT